MDFESEQTHQKFLKDIFERRMIYLEGDITNAMAARITKEIVWLNALDDSSPVTLYIDSPGGEHGAGLDIFDVVRCSQAPVIGVVLRQANSMATIVLQGCKIRKALKHSFITVHNVNITLNLDDLVEKVIKKTQNINWEKQNFINEILSQRTGLSLEKVKRLCRKGKKMYPDEAKKLNLIDEII